MEEQSKIKITTTKLPKGSLDKLRKDANESKRKQSVSKFERENQPEGEDGHMTGENEAG